MDCNINLYNYCEKIGLNIDSAMFLIYEGSIYAEVQDEKYYISDESADILKIMHDIECDLGVNDEGVSVILGLREKVITYQDIIKTIMDSISKSKSIDELIFNLERSKIQNKIRTNEGI